MSITPDKELTKLGVMQGFVISAGEIIPIGEDTAELMLKDLEGDGPGLG